MTVLDEPSTGVMMTTKPTKKPVLKPKDLTPKKIEQVKGGKIWV